MSVCVFVPLTYQVLISVSGTSHCVGDTLDGTCPYIKVYRVLN
jgi:hypothetical protein